MIVVLFALLGSLSVLPALLHKLGDRVDWGRVPYFTAASRGESTLLDRRRRARAAPPGALRRTLRRRCSSLLALPALKLHTKLPSFTDLPKDLPIVQTYERDPAAFPGSQTPAVVVVRATTSPRRSSSRRIAQFRHAGGRDRRVLRSRSTSSSTPTGRSRASSSRSPAGRRQESSITRCRRCATT